MARRKIQMEKNSKPKMVAEELAEVHLKKYSPEDFAVAVNDLSIKIDNAYFRTPYARCKDCDKGNNTIMAHFGIGGSNKIGNLSGFQATVGDVIAWKSRTFEGLSVIKTKDNGIFGLETSSFPAARKEPAVVEKVLIPTRLRPIIGEMAMYLANKDSPVFNNTELAIIGEREYPVDIAGKL